MEGIRRGMIEDPDAELVARAGQGDRAAAQALMARHLPKMTSLARRMLGDGNEAEDAVQDAFMRLWTHAARWQPGQAKFETWLYRVTLNQCYDRLRARKTVDLDAALHVADPSPSPESRLSDATVSRAIAAAVQELPERQRAAIALCHYQECGNIEAAEILGVSVEALESLLARGRRSLRARLSHLKDF
jgi:RNA polymerase sigma-70 factor (ECF subfamily)